MSSRERGREADNFHPFSQDVIAHVPPRHDAIVAGAGREGVGWRGGLNNSPPFRSTPMKIAIEATYRDQPVVLTVDSDAAKAAGITLETALELVLKHYGPRQYASKVEAAVKKDKTVPEWDEDAFIKWMLAEKRESTAEPSKADKAEGVKLAAALTERYKLCQAGTEGAGEWEEVEPQLYAKLCSQLSAAKPGFKAPAYDPEEAYVTPDFWSKLMRSFRLYQPKVTISL